MTRPYRMPALPALRAIFLGLALLLAAALLATRAEASRLVRVAPGDDIAALIGELPDDMVILMSPGTYRLSLVLAGRRLVFSAPEGALVEAADQGFAFWLEDGAEIAMDGLEIRGTPGGQPAVVVQGATLRLKDVSIDNPDERALYIDGMLEAEGGRIASGGATALFVAGGEGATLRGVEIVSEAGVGIAVQNAGRLVVEQGRLSGKTALQAVNMGDEVRIIGSRLEGRGDEGFAAYVETSPRLDMENSRLDGAVALQARDIGGQMRIGGSRLQGRIGGLLARDLGRAEIRDSRLHGGVALQAVSVGGGLTVANSLLEGLGESGLAMALEGVSAMKLADSLLLAPDSALTGSIGDGQAWQIEGSLLASRGGGAVGVNGTLGAELRFEVSAAIALGENEEGFAFLSQGAGFAPLIGDSLLLARGGNALVVQNGAGALVERSLLGGSAGPLWMADHEPEITFITESLLVPDVQDDAQLRTLMDIASRQLSSADPALMQRVAQNILFYLADALEETPEDPEAELEALEATFIDIGELRAELAAMAGSLAEARIRVTDLVGQTDTGLPFMLRSLDGEEIFFSDESATIFALPPGEYIASSPGTAARRVTLAAGENLIELEAPDALLVTLRADMFKDEQPRQILLPLRPLSERAAALATLLPPWVFAGAAAPRADAPPEAVAEALRRARDYLGAYRAAGYLLPEDEAERKRTKFTVALARWLLMLYGDAARDAPLLAAVEGFEPATNYYARLVQTALLEARAGMLERGVLAAELARPTPDERLIPALLLHRYGVDAGTQALLRDLNGLDTWRSARALQGLLDVSDPRLAVAARRILPAAKLEESLPFGAAGAALAWLLTNSQPQELSTLAPDLPALSEWDLRYLAPLIADMNPLLELLGAAARDPFEPPRLLIARRGLREAPGELGATLNAVADIAPPKQIHEASSPYANTAKILLGDFLPSGTAAGLLIGGRADETYYTRSEPGDLPRHAFRPDLRGEVAALIASDPDKALPIIGYLPFAEAAELVSGLDLSVFPDPELIRAGLPLVSRAFDDDSLSRRLPVGQPADGSFTIPFTLADPVAEGKFGVNGATSGVLLVQPQRTGSRLRFDIRLNYRNVYVDRCALVFCAENEEYRFFPYVTPDAGRLIADLRLLRPLAGGGYETIPAKRTPGAGFTRFTAMLEPEETADRLLIAFTVQYGALRLPAVKPLWSTQFARLERQTAPLRAEARDLRNDPDATPADLADAAARLTEAGLAGEAATLWQAWGQRNGQRAEGTLRAADVLFAARAPELAAGVLREGLVEAPANGDLLYALGLALEAAEDHPGAQAAFEELFATNPNDTEALALAARNALFAGDAARARDLYAALPDAAQGPRQRALAALAARATGDETPDKSAFIADLAALAAQRPGVAAPSAQALHAALDPSADTPPSHCDLAAFGGRWLGGETGAGWLQAARSLCPEGDVSAHLAHGAPGVSTR